MNYYSYQQGLLFFMISRPNMSFNFIKLYMDALSEMEFGRRNYDRPKLEASHEQ